MKKAFSNELYVELQSKHIQERIQQFDNKLYLEFGGKLFDDHHASRVLPGFEPDSKLKMLLTLKDKVEVIIAVCAKDLERHKVRGDLGRPEELCCHGSPQSKVEGWLQSLSNLAK